MIKFDSEKTKTITYSQRCTAVEVSGWISNFISHFIMHFLIHTTHFTGHVITFPCWDHSQSMLVSGAPVGMWVPWGYFRKYEHQASRGYRIMQVPFASNLPVRKVIHLFTFVANCGLWIIGRLKNMWDKRSGQSRHPFNHLFYWCQIQQNIRYSIQNKHNKLWGQRWN